MDSDEATKEQLNFIAKVKRFYESQTPEQTNATASDPNLYEFRTSEPLVPYETEFSHLIMVGIAISRLHTYYVNTLKYFFSVIVT